MVHAHGAGPILMSIENNDNNNNECNISILAWDGIYLNEKIILNNEKTINLVAAGRVEVEILCSKTGNNNINLILI